MKQGKFISLEGIDGSGKSSVSSLIVSSLPNTVLVDKNIENFIEDPFARQQLINIKKSLWDYSKDYDILTMGSYHWLLLISSWYSALGYILKHEYLDKGINIVSDGWYFKYLARFLIKSEFSDDFLSQLFYPITKPDIVILLDVDANIAFERKNITSISQSELGLADGIIGSKRQGFVEYQNQVRNNYLSIANKQDWSVLPLERESLKDSVNKVLLLLE